MESKNNIQNRILQSKILLKAPTDIVWEMWTNPEHISNWWGPMVLQIQFIKWILRKKASGI